jgi:hypothetical protein
MRRIGHVGAWLDDRRPRPAQPPPTGKERVYHGPDLHCIRPCIAVRRSAFHKMGDA